MTVKRVMGTETEYAVSLNTPDRYNPVQLSFDVVNGAADSHSKSIRWDYRQEDPVNDARGTRLERSRRPPGHAHRRPAAQHHQCDRPQRRPRLCGPRPPRILGAGNHRPVRSGPIRPRRRPHHAGRHRTRPQTDWHSHCPASQQCGWQGLLLGHARELYDGPRGAIRLGHTPDDPPLRHPPDLRRLRPRRDWREQRDSATSSASAPTTSTPKSACKPPSNARSSIRATNPTPPMHTAVCTSSSATPIAWRCRRH